MPTPNALPEQAIARFRAGLLKCGCGPDQAFGICVSGGADSLALLLLAKAASLKIKAVTVDHRLRAESATEAAHVAAICAQLGVAHEIVGLNPSQMPVRPELVEGLPSSSTLEKKREDFDKLSPNGGEGKGDKPLVTSRHGNLSDWARTARYAALRDWAARAHVDVLMTAHHADDQLETMLMRLNRGSGVAGLAGVRARQADLCRPLLGWCKRELVELVDACGLCAVNDPTNHDEAYDRARLRKHLAKVDWLDPQAAALSAAALADANDALDWVVQGLLDEHLSHLSRHPGGGRGRLDVKNKPEAAPASAGATETLIFTCPPLPRELLRRVVNTCILKLNPSAKPRGDALDRLVATLQHGGIATLAGVKCSGGTHWHFTLAAPRRTK